MHEKIVIEKEYQQNSKKYFPEIQFMDFYTAPPFDQSHIFCRARPVVLEHANVVPTTLHVRSARNAQFSHVLCKAVPADQDHEFFPRQSVGCGEEFRRV